MNHGQFHLQSPVLSLFKLFLETSYHEAPKAFHYCTAITFCDRCGGSLLAALQCLKGRRLCVI